MLQSAFVALGIRSDSRRLFVQGLQRGKSPCYPRGRLSANARYNQHGAIRLEFSNHRKGKLRQARLQAPRMHIRDYRNARKNHGKAWICGQSNASIRAKPWRSNWRENQRLICAVTESYPEMEKKKQHPAMRDISASSENKLLAAWHRVKVLGNFWRYHGHISLRRIEN